MRKEKPTLSENDNSRKEAFHEKIEEIKKSNLPSEEEPILLNHDDSETLNKIEEEIQKIKIKMEELQNTRKDRQQKIRMGDALESLNEKLIETQKIFIDKYSRPFLYFTFSKSVNPFILEKYQNSKAELLDLRKIKSIDIMQPLPTRKRETREEIIFKYNIFGMILTLDRADKFMTQKYFSDMTLGTEVFGEKNTNWKVIGPEGRIMKEKINWDEAQEIYSKETENQKEKIIKEYESKNGKLAKII